MSMGPAPPPYEPGPPGNAYPTDPPPEYESLIEVPNMAEVPAPPVYEPPKLEGVENEVGSMNQSQQGALHSPLPHLPRLAYADFLPRCLQAADGVSRPKYDGLKTVMSMVNDWLVKKPQYRVVRCESIERKLNKNGALETETTIHHEGAFTTCFFIRGIRLWLVPTNGDAPPQQLWYLNAVPMATPIVVGHTHRGLQMQGMRGMHCYSTVGWPAFESLDQLLKKLNAKLRQQPLPGSVLTIESIDMKYAEGFDWRTIDPDCMFWSEGKGLRLFLTTLRVFFVLGQPQAEEIGIEDFPPLAEPVSGSLMLNVPKFENYSGMIVRANTWLNNQRGIRFTNAQTITCKLETSFLQSEVSLPTRKMEFLSGMSESTFVQVVRMGFVRGGKPQVSLPSLTTRAFVPVRLNARGSETTSQTVWRVNGWLSCVAPRVIGVDTLQLEFNPTQTYPVNTEKVRHKIIGGSGHYFIVALRLYFDGQYQEPPPEVFPPIPASINTVSNESECCEIL